MSLFLSPYGYVEDDLCTYDYMGEDDPVESDTDKENGKTVEYYPLGSDDTWLPYFFAVCFLFVKMTESLQVLSNVGNYILDLFTQIFRRNEPGVFFPNWARVSTVLTTENNGHHSVYRYCNVLVNRLTENYVYLNPDRITVREVMAQHPSLMMNRGLLTIKLREMRYLRVIDNAKDSAKDITENDDIAEKDDIEENDDITENEGEPSNTSFLGVEFRHTSMMTMYRTYSMHIPVEDMYVGNHILSKEYIASYFEHKNWWNRPPFAVKISKTDDEDEYIIYVMDRNLAVAHLGPHQYLEIKKEGYQICNR